MKVKNNKKNKPKIKEINKEIETENKEQILKYSNRKKCGPYSKSEKDKRRDEVYKLHFEYGYSARKISEFMKVNRNTINADVDFWYSNIVERTPLFRPESTIITNLQRFEIQRTRLRENLDQSDSSKEKIALERLMYDIDSKIVHICIRLAESDITRVDESLRMLNKWMIEHNLTHRFVAFYQTLRVSKNAKEKIHKIMEEDELQIFQHGSSWRFSKEKDPPKQLSKKN